MTTKSKPITEAWLKTLSTRQVVLGGARWVLGVGANGRPCVVKRMGDPGSTVFHIHYGGEELRRVEHRSDVLAFCEILGVPVESEVAV